MKKLYFKILIIALGLSATLMVLPSCNQKNEYKIEQNEGEEEEENDEYDGPEKAAEFERKRNKDPFTGDVPYGKMWEAVMETESLKNSYNNNNNATAALAPLAWEERGSNSDAAGPFGNSRPGNGVTSGRMRAVLVDVGDATGNTVWVGGVDGGIWKTTNVSAALPTWTNSTDYLSNLAVSGIAQSPVNPNIMYFCTGESYFTGFAVGGVGVFKSVDHGVTWTLLANTSTFVRCTKIMCDAAGNVYVSTLGLGSTFALNRSTNGGTSWTNINPFEAGVNQTSRIPDFEISSTGRMHVIGGFSSATAAVGGYRYTDDPTAAVPVWQSAATLFTWPFGASARTEICVVGNTVYASLAQATGSIDAIAKSTDGGANWTTIPLSATNITDLNGTIPQGSYAQGLMADPSNSNTVIIGGLRLIKSTDGGATFTRISQWVGTTGQYVHADIHNIQWVDNGNKLFIGTDGGLFFSANKGTTFSDKNTGLRLKQFYGVSMHPTATNYFLAGAQDNGTHQFNGPGLTSSVEVLGGDGGITAIDQNEPQFQTGAYVNANFRRTTNGGSTWSSSGSASTSGQFICPYDYDDVKNLVYSSFDPGTYMRWENPQSGFTFTTINASLFGTGTVSCVTVSPYTANRVFFGVDNGRIIQVDNADQAAPTFTDITPTGVPTNGYINSIAIGTSDQQITATLSNATATTVTNIWNSTNGGTSWVAADGNLPEMPVYWSLYHPDAVTKMYIATETGVWSTDALNGTGTVWTAESTFPTVKTSMLEYRTGDRTIAASTYGRGLWTAIIPNTSCTAASISTQPINATICAGLNTTFTIAAAGSAPLTYQWQVSTAGAGGPWANVANNAVYSNATTNSLTITAATTTLSTYQYRCVVSNCAATPANSNPAILTVNALPAAPTVVSPINYCQGVTAPALNATGTNLLWYTTSTGGTGSATAPTPSTSASGTVVYYVSQTVGTCQGPRAAITVNVAATPPAPAITNATTNYCQGAAALPLNPAFIGPGPDPTDVIKWYTVAIGGVALAGVPTPSTATLGSTIYYISITSGACEGPRTAMTVNITAVPLAPVVTSTVTYCQGVTATALTATGSNLLWYTTATGGTGSATAPIPATASVGTTSYYVSQTTGCESPRATINVTVVAGTPAPTVTSPLAYCQGVTAAVLSATGTNLLWYTASVGGTGSATAPIPSTTTAGSITYYVSQTSGVCESPRAAIVVNTTATPLAPTVNSPVNYCQNVAATPLTAIGTNIKWYTTSIGGVASTTAPTPLTTALGTTTYYVSQTTGTCEGPRAAINVIVSAVSPAPTVASPVIYCQGTTAVALTATGTNLLWYTTLTGGTGSATAPIPSTAAAGNTIYYVSQNSTCGESARTPLTVTVTATPAAPTTSALQYCQGATALALTATGSNLLWYTAISGGTGSATAPIPSTTTVGVVNYYVSQTISSCESPRALLVVTTNATPAAPTVASPLTYCLNATAPALTATGTNLKWYTTITGGVGSATAPISATNTIGSITYYVSQTTGTCEGPRAAIVVNVTAITAAPVVTSPIAYCQGATAAALTATGTGLLWYTTLTGGTGSATAPTISTATAGSTTYYVSQTGTCESARSAIVVNINPTPVAPTATAAIGYCQGSTATALTASGTGLLWYTVSAGGTGSATAPIPSTATAGSTTYYVSQTTGTCEGPRTAIVVNVSAAPSINAQPQDVASCSTSATFNVTATGTSLTYQWFLSTDGGGTFNAIAGATSSTLVVSGLTAAQANYKYRVVVSSGTCTVATSNSVSAKVGVTPVVVLTTAPVANFNPYTNGGLFTTVSPAGNYTYQWKRNNATLTNTGTSITKANGLLDDFGTYIVTVTDPLTNCSGVSNSIVVNDIEAERSKLFTSPNPTTGLVTVSYYSTDITTAQTRIINVYDSKGARVITKTVTLVGRYGTTTIDLSKLANDTYVFVIKDASGKKLATQRVVKY
jgi:Ig-like domain CHU_C associated